MALALYRKYRPSDFEGLQGQSATKETLLQALKQNKISHAYLFSGPRGTGKTSTARLIAKAIQCENRDEQGQACDQCEICVQNARNELVDTIEIDAASNRGIDEIRDLREKIRFAPSYAKAKVYIIDEVHMLTKEAFNALLKSLEEPPAHVYFILATTELHKIPETILSRCQRYEFKRISQDDIVARLQNIAEKEGFSAEVGALQLIAEHADGGMRDAITLLEQFSNAPITEERIRERLGLVHQAACESLYVALQNADAHAALDIIETLHKNGADLSQFAIHFLGLLRKKLHEAVTHDKTRVPSILEWVQHFDEAWVNLKRASISQLPLEIAVIRSTHVQAIPAVMTAPTMATPTVAPSPQSKRPEGLSRLDQMKEKLNEALSALENPALRNSFKTGQLTRAEAGEWTVQFSSKFHYDKVQPAEVLLRVEERLSELFGEKLKLSCTLEEGVLASEVTSIDTLGWETVEEKL